jgi:hypothetical protein
MKRLLVPFLIGMLALAASALAMDRPSFHTEGTPNGKPTGPLKAGEYWWAPNISPNGPVVVLISLPQQIMNVYRNGVIVARSSVSTGMQGHSTPTGVFTILEKSAKHYSKTYDNAPMPYMERLTWDGVAFHSGYLPGHAASHGCIRLPYEFSKKLFELTQKGGTVVIGDYHSLSTSLAADPGLVLPVLQCAAPTGQPLAKGDYTWRPEHSMSGPVTVVFSAADRTLYVYRNGVRIGRAAVAITGFGKFGNHVFTRITDVNDTTSKNRWMTVGKGGRKDRSKFDSLRKRISFSPEFREKLRQVIVPGTTVVVTDMPVAGKRNRDVTFGN